MDSKPTRELFERLVCEIADHPKRRAELEDQIKRIFSRRAAILALDMCGFSRTTQAHGIVAFLVMIHEMQRLCEPAVRSFGGFLVKSEADNLFCLFDSPADALAAALDIHVRCAAANAGRSADHALHAAIGIGFGDTLYVGKEDLHGDEMNIACKLGEDIAELGDILLTSAAHAELPAGTVNATRHTVSISGLALDYFRIAR